MLAWAVRLFLKPRLRSNLGWLDAALWGLFVWSVISSLFSYEPAVSLDKLRGAAVFLIFYFAFYNIRTRRAAALMAVVLIGSCMVNVVWMPIERLIGRGVEISGVSPEGPLGKALLFDGDTLLQVNGRDLATPEDVVAAMAGRESSRVKFYRPDFEFTVEVRGSDLLAGETAMEKLGISGWKKSRNWRSQGFFGHFTTYAEVLQLIGSLAFGLLVAAFRGRKELSGQEGAATVRGVLAAIAAPKFLLLAFCVSAIAFALLLTVTRAPQLAFFISAGAIVLAGLGKRTFLLAVVVAVPLAVAGLLFLQRSRNVDFFDAADESTRYRQMMWRDGVRLWTENPRHFFFGAGMDSIKNRWQEWGMFEGGRQPLGHFHSTPLQLAVERGLPALLLWLCVLGVYARALWKWLAEKAGDPADDARGFNWWERGIVLGCFGGLLGFFISGLVHYNLGDQEVAMVFFMLMGLSLSVTVTAADGSQDTDISR
jgi:putative inorganic carbon (hco3(-)) transporter